MDLDAVDSCAIVFLLFKLQRLSPCPASIFSPNFWLQHKEKEIALQ
jgi:hypothetical protein